MVISNLKIGTSYFFTPLEEFAKENIRYLPIFAGLSDIRQITNFKSYILINSVLFSQQEAKLSLIRELSNRHAPEQQDSPNSLR